MSRLGGQNRDGRPLGRRVGDREDSRHGRTDRDSAGPGGADPHDRYRPRRSHAEAARCVRGSGGAADDRHARQGPRAAGGAVPLRRCAPGVLDAAGRHAPPARVARGRAGVPARAPGQQPHRAQARRTPRRGDRRRRREADGPALHRGGGRQGRAPRDHQAVEAGRRDDRRPARRGDRLRGRGRPLRRPLRGDAARARRRGHEARPGQPVREGLRVDAAAASRGAGARDRGRAPASAAPPARGARGRSAPARRHGVLRHARGDHAAHARPALPAGVRGRPVRRDRPAGLPRRLARVPRGAARVGARDAARATRSRSAWSRAPTGTTRSSRPPSTGGRRRCSPTAAPAIATSSC